MKMVKKNSTEHYRFYSLEKSLYIAWTRFRNDLTYFSGEFHLGLKNGEVNNSSWYAMLHPEDLTEARAKHIQCKFTIHYAGRLTPGWPRFHWKGRMVLLERRSKLIALPILSITLGIFHLLSLLNRPFSCAIFKVSLLF